MSVHFSSSLRAPRFMVAFTIGELPANANWMSLTTCCVLLIWLALPFGPSRIPLGEIKHLLQLLPHGGLQVLALVLLFLDEPLLTMLPTIGVGFTKNVLQDPGKLLGQLTGADDADLHTLQGLGQPARHGGDDLEDFRLKLLGNIGRGGTQLFDKALERVPLLPGNVQNKKRVVPAIFRPGLEGFKLAVRLAEGVEAIGNVLVEVGLPEGADDFIDLLGHTLAGPLDGPKIVAHADVQVFINIRQVGTTQAVVDAVERLVAPTNAEALIGVILEVQNENRVRQGQPVMLHTLAVTVFQVAVEVEGAHLGLLLDDQNLRGHPAAHKTGALRVQDQVVLNFIIPALGHLEEFIA